MASNESKFVHVLNIWLEKPHVACSSIFGAKYVHSLETSSAEQDPQIVVFTRQLLHNSLDVEPLVERIVLSPLDLQAEFFTQSDDQCLYRVFMMKSDDNTGQYRIAVSVCREPTQLELRYHTADWLKSSLSARLNRWLAQCRDESKDLVKTPASLACVDLALYQAAYYRMKAVYGPKLIANWSERTNAEKFVYEDIGIAAYLLCQWQGQTGVKFVDIGCGNGLLVYLLNSEGHRGIGYDIRKRKIWDTYPESVRAALIEQTIVPTAQNLAFPGVDWLLGNHSDELTPWLPVLGARFKCQGVFLLPCCPFNFDGSRYDRRGLGGTDDSSSRYRNYLAYIGELCQRVGYDSVRRDCLRIPSTRRVCFVATQLDSERSNVAVEEISGSEFRPRLAETETTPRNCSRVPVDTRRRVELALFRALLGDESDKDCLDVDEAFDADKDHVDEAFVRDRHSIDNSSNDDKDGAHSNDATIQKVCQPKRLKRDPDSHCAQNHSIINYKDSKHKSSIDSEALKLATKTWNAGRSLPLSTLIDLLSETDRAALKNECGGLQTLLRNCHQAFVVRSGVASIRQPTPVIDSAATAKQRLHRKSKPCFMDAYHPDGCCLLAGDCAFKHECELDVTD